ncbi:unnamed protein product [Medioppia subpectinata]|uniref:Cytochrome P450 n=1 Tax=Medioppia subpectinata TaxID=1979941 RepID=A0A7R9KS50_9ACAR|nr:unnamed protein product [Medioppia subpectinata]CAG2108530.1 unnamed protein product [Medioppia subpectinata]
MFNTVLTRVFEGNQATLSVADPVLIKQILVKDFHTFAVRPALSNTKQHLKGQSVNLMTGDEWVRQRSAVSPLFTSGRMRRAYPIIDTCLQHLMDTLAESGPTVDINQAYKWYAMDAIGAIAWGVETDARHRPDEPLVRCATEIAHISPLKTVLFRLLPHPVLSALGLNSLHSTGINRQMHEILRQLVDSRRRQSRHDFISQLLSARPTTSRVIAGSDGTDESQSYEGHHINEG